MMVTGLLKERMNECGGDLVLTDKWARAFFEKRNWSKREGTTGKVHPPSSFYRRKIHFSDKYVSTVF